MFKVDFALFICMAYLLVDRPGDGDPLLLSAAEVDPVLADERRVAVLEQLEVVAEGAGRDGLAVPFLVQVAPEEQVVLDRPVLRGDDSNSICSLIFGIAHVETFFTVESTELG